MLIVFEELLYLRGQVKRRPEGVADGVAHPPAIGYGHVAAVHAGLQQEDAVQVIGLAVVEHIDQIRHHAAVGVFGHGHLAALGIALAVAVKMRLTELGVLHLRDDHVHFGHDGEIAGHEVKEVAGHQHLAVILRPGVVLGVVHQFAEVALHRAHLELPVIPVKGRAVGEGGVVLQ